MTFAVNRHHHPPLFQPPAMPFDNAQLTGEADPSKSRKRNRAVLSCLTCHQRRVKCDRSQPCKACISYGSAESCTFESPTERRVRRRRSGDSGGRGQGSSSSERELDSDQAHRSLPDEEEQARPLAMLRGEAGPTLQSASFTAFVDRFQQHSAQAVERGTQKPAATTTAAAASYPPSSAASIKAARLDLPVPERATLMVLFFMEQLDWMYEAGDYDDMDQWLGPFLTRMSGPSSLDNLTKGDATRLCLVITMLAATMQIASEGLLKIYFLDAAPVGLSHSTLSRSTVKERYETHIRNLLDMATQHDGASADLIRCSIIYMHFLKNEGRHGESGNRPLMSSLSQLVEKAQLHLEPDASYSPLERESRRRLFWTFFCFNRMSCAHLGYPIQLADGLIKTHEPSKETWSPLMGRRIHLTIIYRVKLARIAAQLAAMLQNNSTSVKAIETIEQRFQAFIRSLPPELHPSLPPLAPDLRQLRTFDLQRHVFQIFCNSVHGSIHRLCFFPSQSIPLERVQKSRKICTDAALSMIKAQESLRMRLVSEHHLRCFYVPYYLLESSITLVLASLIELGNTLAGKDMPETVHEYMRWSHRARNILTSIPSDFAPAVQGVRLLSRVLAKAAQIIDLRAQHKLTPTDSNTAIREVLCDDEGRRQPIPFLEPAHCTTRFSPPVTDTHGQSVKGEAGTTSSCSTGPSDGSTALTTPPYLSTGNSGLYSAALNDFVPGVYAGTVEPTYADLGIDFFNSLALALPNPFSADADLQEHFQQQQQTSAPAVTPQQHGNPLGLDDQMDSWLASLQHFA